MMTEHAELIQEINKLPAKYIGEVLDFVGYLRQKDTTGAHKTAEAGTKRAQRDVEIINANAQRFNQEAEENLQFQALP